MQTLKITIKPLTRFGSKMSGDTLFGQFCWGIVNVFGEDVLNKKLEGYTEGKPFIVFSSAFKEGFIPRPQIPAFMMADTNVDNRKSLKKISEVLVNFINEPLESWVSKQNEQQIKEQEQARKDNKNKIETKTFSHSLRYKNSINRLTATTDGDGFAPYSEDVFDYHHNLDVYVVYDGDKIDVDEITRVMNYIGNMGYGKNASIGLGKFECEINKQSIPSQKNANSYLTLAPSCPQGLSYDKEKSFYKTFVKFGRHGDIASLGTPFKKPIMMAEEGGVITLKENKEKLLFIGQGIKNISLSDEKTVHQGYSPVIGIRL